MGASSANNIVDLPVRTGQVLDGKFRVERIIGEGAMGLVVEATNLALDERVALKFLRREARARQDIVTRFAREARAAAKISSDHVARVYDVGGTEDDAPFIVMELLSGQDLELVLQEKGSLEISEAVEYVIQACEGLTAAHVHNIVHRDIKPGNLFISERAGMRQVKLLDFGISKAGLQNGFESIDVLSTNTTQIMGSPHYMSPEQVRSTKDVDRRADIWSIGVVLFELITGETPFEGNEVTAIIANVLHEPHRTVRSLRADVPAGLEEVIDNCLIKDPSKRYQTAVELAVALLPFAPKRARAVVERAQAIMARGVSGNPGPHVDSLPPPAPVSGVSRASSTQPSTNPAPEISVVGLSSSIAAPAQEPKQQRTFVAIAVLAIVIGVAGGAYSIVARMKASEEEAQGRGIVPPATTTAPSTATATPSAPAKAAETTATATTTTTATTATATTTTTATTAPATTTTAATATTAPATSTSAGSGSPATVPDWATRPAPKPAARPAERAGASATSAAETAAPVAAPPTTSAPTPKPATTPESDIRLER